MLAVADTYHSSTPLHRLRLAIDEVVDASSNNKDQRSSCKALNGEWQSYLTTLETLTIDAVMSQDQWNSDLRSSQSSIVVPQSSTDVVGEGGTTAVGLFFILPRHQQQSCLLRVLVGCM